MVTDPVFETGAASLYLPAFLKMRNWECGVRNDGLSSMQFRIPNSTLRMAARVGLAPTPNGLTGRRATLTLPGNGQLALPAGVAPASVRLEDERLVYFGHGSGRAGLMD